MKLFQTVQKNLMLVGYMRNQAGYRYYAFGRRHFISSVLFSIATTSIFIFATHTANSPAEYMDAFYLLAVLLSILVSHMSITLKMTKLFDFIDNLEKVYDKSKFHRNLRLVTKYSNSSSLISCIQQTGSDCPEQKVELDRINEIVELLSTVIHILVVKIGVPCIILPKAILSFYKYIATDAGNDAFKLAVASS